MSQNWMRYFELQLLNKEGKGIGLSDFKVIFRIEWNDTKWPRVATIKVYNLSPDTSNRIMGEEFTKIQLMVGYEGMAAPVNISDVGKVRSINPEQAGQMDGKNYALLFQGDIRFTIKGCDNLTDSWVQIQALGDHEAFLYARTKKTLAAGYNVETLLNAAMEGFNAFGVTKGIIGPLPDTVFPRSRTIYAASHVVMDQVAEMCNATWQLVDGQVQMIPVDRYIDTVVVLNGDTGLIGRPEQTMGGGVNVRCLINPNIRINTLIHIDQASIYRAAFSTSQIAQSTGRMMETNDNGYYVVKDTGAGIPPASIAADGMYIVKSIFCIGDTRGKEWYMDLMCFAVGSADPMSGEALRRFETNNQ